MTRCSLLLNKCLPCSDNFGGRGILCTKQRAYLSGASNLYIMISCKKHGLLQHEAISPGGTLHTIRAIEKHALWISVKLIQASRLKILRKHPSSILRHRAVSCLLMDDWSYCCSRFCSSRSPFTNLSRLNWWTQLSCYPYVGWSLITIWPLGPACIQACGSLSQTRGKGIVHLSITMRL